MYTGVLRKKQFCTKTYIFMTQVKTDQALQALTSLWKFSEDSTIQVKLPEYKMNSFKFTKTISSTKKHFIPGDFVVVNPQFIGSLPVGELKMVVKIIAALKINNALWSFDYRNTGRKERAFLELRKKGLIIDIGIDDIHIINPFFLRKGRIEAVIPTTYHIIESQKTISKTMIKDQKPPDQTTINGYFTSQL